MAEREFLLEFLLSHEEFAKGLTQFAQSFIRGDVAQHTASHSVLLLHDKALQREIHHVREREARLREALREIASCGQIIEGDVVHIARKALRATSCEVEQGEGS